MKSKGGLVQRKDGRWRVNLRSGSRQLYSRCLMEAHLGRHLTYEEVVHHINGDPTDDRIENLAVVTRAEHASLHKREIRDGIHAKKSKLTQAQVAEIKVSTERTSVLARRFGVTEGAITYHRGAFHYSIKAQGRG